MIDFYLDESKAVDNSSARIFLDAELADARIERLERVLRCAKNVVKAPTLTTLAALQWAIVDAEA